MRGSFNGFDHSFNQNRRRFNTVWNLALGFICLVTVIILAWYLFLGSMLAFHGNDFIQAIINLMNATANNLNR